MITFLRIFISFSLTFFILCIPINNKELFYHIKSVTQPAVTTGLNESKKLINMGFNSTVSYVKQLFGNNQTNDRVQTMQSSTQKKNINYYKEEYSDSEQKRLEKIITDENK